MSTVRTRIAPSPTGLFHLGTARAALFNYLYARRNGGQFILRIEDTDKERSKPEYEKDIVDGLHWLGISYDEGPIRQSERAELYKKYIHQLLEEGKAGWCDVRDNPGEKGVPAAHWCENHGGFNAEGKGIIRFKVPRNRSIAFSDIIRDDVRFDSNLLGDFSIAKDADTALYNLAVVIDDELMKISHVIRGEDHISNTPKQMLLIEALGFSQPQYAHLPLILGPDRSKLSKRHGAESLNEFREEGYLPEAMVNFMALLGWNPGDEREFFALADLEKEFALERVQKGGAVFNREKLDSINAYYIRQKSPQELAELSKPYAEKAGIDVSNKDLFMKAIVLEQPRLKKLSEIAERVAFFFKVPQYESALLAWKGQSPDETKRALESALRILDGREDISKEHLEQVFFAEAEGNFSSKGELLWPVRVALSGQKASPGPFEIIEALGIDESRNRIRQAIVILS